MSVSPGAQYHPAPSPGAGNGITDVISYISRLGLQDIRTLQSRAQQRDANTGLTDQELAWALFAEEAEGLLNIAREHVADGINDGSRSLILEELEEMEEAARYDHLVALAISEGNPIPPPPDRPQRDPRRTTSHASQDSPVTAAPLPHPSSIEAPSHPVASSSQSPLSPLILAERLGPLQSVVQARPPTTSIDATQEVDHEYNMSTELALNAPLARTTAAQQTPIDRPTLLFGTLPMPEVNGSPVDALTQRQVPAASETSPLISSEQTSTLQISHDPARTRTPPCSGPDSTETTVTGLGDTTVAGPSLLPLATRSTVLEQYANLVRGEAARPRLSQPADSEAIRRFAPPTTRPTATPEAGQSVSFRSTRSTTLGLWSRMMSHPDQFGSIGAESPAEAGSSGVVHHPPTSLTGPNHSLSSIASELPPQIQHATSIGAPSAEAEEIPAVDVTEYTPSRSLAGTSSPVQSGAGHTSNSELSSSVGTTPMPENPSETDEEMDRPEHTVEAFEALFEYVYGSCEETAAETGEGDENDDEGEVRDSPPRSGTLCIICGDDVWGAYTAPCGHTFDRDCLGDLFHRATHDESLYPPSCCHQRIDIINVKDFLASSVAAAFTEKAREYDTLDRIYCHQPRCSAFLGAATAEPSILSCPLCAGHATCGMCKEEAHPGTKCSDTQELNQLAVDMRTQNGWQRCRSCGHLVYKFDGCHHITCMCRAEFCYLCAAPWKTCDCARFDVPAEV